MEVGELPDYIGKFLRDMNLFGLSRSGRGGTGCSDSCSLPQAPQSCLSQEWAS